ncbi:hypothetical protein D3C75_1205320 [compost metagenome]
MPIDDTLEVRHGFVVFMDSHGVVGSVLGGCRCQSRGSVRLAERGMGCFVVAGPNPIIS